MPAPASVSTRCFSALQRAENSSISCAYERPAGILGFSALQRAENSSIQPRERRNNRRQTTVSVLFSEPKIPQFCDARLM